MADSVNDSPAHLSDDSVRSILVKSVNLPKSLFFGKAKFTARPLLPNIEGGGRGLADIPRWHIVASPDLDDANLWDLCHQLRQQGVDATAGIEFAEPNLRQQWTWMPPEQQAGSAREVCVAREQNSSYPRDPDKRWYVGPGHDNFQNGNAGDGVRIAHFDTGYDPKHLSLPRNLDHANERNFVDSRFPKDAQDRVHPGRLNNVGHGTGTLSILAGAPIQGAANPSPGVVADATIVPIRVANSVVLFENAAIAQAFDHVYGLCTAGTFVDVITMSMGGLASRAWADAVNAIYDLGIFIVTAAGNNYGELPLRNIVYPARFNRVVAACGVMADGRPYADLGPSLMAGNYGPPSKMRTAMAASTPNVPWAQIGCPDVINWDGNGTSSATPQIAGAAARWIAKNRAALAAYPAPWMRIEAVRAALFASARKNNEVHFGQGTLNADASLQELPAPASSLTRQAEDRVSFPLLGALAGSGLTKPADTPMQAMLELEALQLSQSHEIERLLPDPQEIDGLTGPQMRDIADALASQPQTSKALREALGVGAARR